MNLRITGPRPVAYTARLLPHIGGQGGNRTPTSPGLSRLPLPFSHSPNGGDGRSCTFTERVLKPLTLLLAYISIMVGAEGLEPSTLWLKANRSSPTELRPHRVNQPISIRQSLRCSAVLQKSSAQAQCYQLVNSKPHKDACSLLQNFVSLL